MAKDYEIMQNPSNKCADKSEIENIFGKSKVEVQINDFESAKKLFGDPTRNDFRSKISKVELSGFGKDKGNTLSISVHNSLHQILISIFSKIKSANLDYVLHKDSTWGYTFKYKTNDTNKNALTPLPDYNSIRPAGAWPSWSIDCANHDLKNGRLNDFITVNSKQVRRYELLSNHCFGSAIDINAATNPFPKKSNRSTTAFDMRKEIIDIFQEHGFYWGGYYHDYMHFEYVLSTIMDTAIKYSLPLDISTGYDPTQEAINKYYLHNEQEHRGGFYPIGANTTWHGGIHIRGKTGDPVMAMSGGKIVAARLAEKENAWKAYGSNNFILCEHSYKEQTFYSLYAHLNGEKLDKNNNKIADVKWLQKPGGKDIDTDLLMQLADGKVHKIDRKITGGDKLWTLGEYGSSGLLAPILHWEVFSEKIMPGAWITADDKNEDFNCDNKKIVEIVDSPGSVAFVKTKPDGFLDADEIREFYKNPQQCEKLRYYACRFITEFGVDWDKAVNVLKGRFITYGLAEKIKVYNFWDEAKAAGVTLPASKIVWHYHPAAFLEQILFTSSRARIEGIHFETNHSFPLNNPQFLSLINATNVHMLVRGRGAVLILGYAATSENDKDALSLQRAEAISFLLTGKKDAWVEMFTKKKKWGHRERQIMLKNIWGTDGKPYYDKEISDTETPEQINAVKKFQKESALNDDGDAGPKTLYAMFDRYYVLLNTGAASVKDVKTVGCADRHQGRPAEHAGDLIAFASVIKPDVTKYKGDEEKVWKDWQESVDFEITSTGTEISSALQFKYPAEKEHKQYVNLADNGKDEGKNLTMTISVENPVEGQTIYWKVTADAGNSERAEPKAGLKENDKASLQELNKGVATCTSKVKGGEATAILVCGAAGGDTFVVEVSVEDGKTLNKITVVTWRRLYYELQSPDFIELEANCNGDKDYPKKTLDRMNAQLAMIFVEYRLKKSISFTKAQCPADTLFKPAYLFLDNKVVRDVHVLPQSAAVHPKPFGVSQKQTIKVRVCDKSFYWETTYVVATMIINNLDATGKFNFNVTSVFKKYCFPKSLNDNKIGIEVTNGSWIAKPPAGHPAHPAINGGTAQSGNLSGWTINNKDMSTIEITPPAGVGSPATYIGATSATKCPVEITLKILLCFEIGGSSSGERQIMVFQKDSPQTMASIICHELGHNMGMTILSEYKPAPSGLPMPKNVDELESDGVTPGVYYRNKYKTTDVLGAGGVRGPSHVGGHCATGVADRATATNLGGKNGSCIMYGEIGGNEPPPQSNFCPNCIKYLKARSLNDITSSWNGRNSQDC